MGVSVTIPACGTCCGETPCTPAVSIVHESEFANGEILGYIDCKNVINEYDPDLAPESGGTCYEAFTRSCTFPFTRTYSSAVDCDTFACNVYKNLEVVLDACQSECVGQITINFGQTAGDCSCTGDIVCTYTADDPDTINTWACEEAGVRCDNGNCPETLNVAEVTLSNAATDAEIVADAVSNLPAYDGTFAGTGLPFSYTTGICDGATQVGQAKFKFFFTPPETGGFKIVWTIKTYDYFTPFSEISSVTNEWTWTPDDLERCIEQESPVFTLDPEDFPSTVVMTEYHYELI